MKQLLCIFAISVATIILLASCSKNEYKCYWMENISGKFEWVIADSIYEEKVSKEYCFNLDSCSGGRGESGGGCYKWAKSANDKQQPW
jgi:hypothetical protein